MMGPREFVDLPNGERVPVRQVSLAEYAEHLLHESETLVEEERERLRTEGNRKARRAAKAKGRRGERVKRPPAPTLDERIARQQMLEIVGSGPQPVSKYPDFTTEWLWARDAKLQPGYEAELRRYCEAASLGEPYEPGPNVIAASALPAVGSFHG